MRVIQESGWKPRILGGWRGPSSLRQTIVTPCNPPSGDGKKKRSTKVSATFGGPNDTNELGPRPVPRGHRKEAEPDYDLANRGRFDKTIPDQVAFHDSDARSVRHLQYVPASRLDEYVFLREGERDGDT